MPRVPFHLDIVIFDLGAQCKLGVCAAVPGLTRAGSSNAQALRRMTAAAVEELASVPALELSRRAIPGEPWLTDVQIEVGSSSGSFHVGSPVSLRLDVLRWRAAERLEVAWIPWLALEVHGRDPKDLEARLPMEVRAALFRRGATRSLRALCELQLPLGADHERVEVELDVPSPLERAAALERPTRKKSVLDEVARPMAKAGGPPVLERDGLITRLADLLGARRATSVLLVGPPGAGKTAIIAELARRAARKELPRLEAVTFRASSGASIVAGQVGFGMWQDRCRELCAEAAREGAILYLGHLFELLQVGRSEHNAQGVASFLRPFIQRGELQVVVECTPEQVPLIDQEDPNLLPVFERLDVEPLSSESARRVVAASAGHWGRRWKHEVTDEGVARIVALHDRYRPHSARPGRMLRFTEGLLRERTLAPGSTLGPREVIGAFARESGMPRFILDEAVAFDLGQARRYFERHVVGQPGAVREVVDVLATTKAALGRPGKPLASLMFVGPTGVGKTELAKVLARFLFGSSNRLVRFDMSEYGDPTALARLTGEGTASGEGLLTAALRRQPFRVVLLDEIEKSHPLFFDLLLQILGEARSTDSRGRVADFSSAVLVMTSNLGAEAYARRAVGFRDDAPDRAAEQAVSAAIRGFFRPELINRLDRIIPFAPLDESSLRQITERRLDELRRREGVARRDLELVVSEEVPPWLSRRGTDRRYGARPLRRAIERDLLAPLAGAVARRPADVSLRAAVELHPSGTRLVVSVRGRGAASSQGALALQAGSSSALERAAELSSRRREVQRLRRSTVVRSLRDEIVRTGRSLEAAARRIAAGRPRPAGHDARERRYLDLQAAEARLEELWAEVCDEEEVALLDLYREADDQDGERSAREAPDRLRAMLRDVMLALYGLRFDHPERMTFALYAEDDELLASVGEVYRQVFAKLGLEVQRLWSVLPGGERPTRHEVADCAAPLQPVAMGRLGLVFDLRGPGAVPRLLGEAGRHVVHRDGSSTRYFVVDCSEASATEYRVPQEMARAGTMVEGFGSNRRAFDVSRGEIRDLRMKRTLGTSLWSKAAQPLVALIESALDDALRRELLS